MWLDSLKQIIMFVFPKKKQTEAEIKEEKFLAEIKVSLVEYKKSRAEYEKEMNEIYMKLYGCTAEDIIDVQCEEIDEADNK